MTKRVKLAGEDMAIRTAYDRVASLSSCTTCSQTGDHLRGFGGFRVITLETVAG